MVGWTGLVEGLLGPDSPCVKSSLLQCTFKRRLDPTVKWMDWLENYNITETVSLPTYYR